MAAVMGRIFAPANGQANFKTTSDGLSTRHDPKGTGGDKTIYITSKPQTLDPVALWTPSVALTVSLSTRTSSQTN